MTDTGERFTVVHRGDRVEVQEGLHGEPNFVVPLESQNLSNFGASHCPPAISTL